MPSDSVFLDHVESDPLLHLLLLLEPKHLLVVLIAHDSIAWCLSRIGHCFHGELCRLDVAEDDRFYLVYCVAVHLTIGPSLARLWVEFFVEPRKSLILVH